MMSDNIETLLRNASFACDLHSDDAFKLVRLKSVYRIVDQLAHDGPEVIFKGTREECVAFLKGVEWGAKAGRSSMAQSF